ncbi:MAG: epimerase [Providencia sp.]|uniref:epimerase n=1 Tax=Providencia sp. TaxID=589 RepID=UPI003F9EB7FE
MILHPSLASADPLWLGAAVDKLANENIGSLHLDIEDGNFISNITFGTKMVKAIRHTTKQAISVHLMVSKPLFWIRELLPFHPQWIFFHPENIQNPSEIIAEIRKIGSKVGLSLNPATPIAPYQYLYEKLDAVMIMTSEPDGQNQQFIPAMVDKIQQVAQLLPQLECWADGGVGFDNISLLKAAGAKHLVVGRALFSSENLTLTLDQLRH